MNAFIVLFVLLVTVAGAYSREDLLGRNLSIYENLSEDEINEVSVQIETEFIKMKSIECRRDDQVPEEFKQNCTDFLKNFELLFYNCFCHKDEVSLCEVHTVIVAYRRLAIRNGLPNGLI